MRPRVFGVACGDRKAAGAQATQPNATGLAIFQRVVREPSHSSMDVCLEEGVLRTATISAYINGAFSWCAFGPPPRCFRRGWMSNPSLRCSAPGIRTALK